MQPTSVYYSRMDPSYTWRCRLFIINNYSSPRPSENNDDDDYDLASLSLYIVGNEQL